MQKTERERGMRYAKCTAKHQLQRDMCVCSLKSSLRVAAGHKTVRVNVTYEAEVHVKKERRRRKKKKASESVQGEMINRLKYLDTLINAR